MINTYLKSISVNQINFVKYFVEVVKINVHNANKQNKNGLHFAAMFNLIEIAKYLIENGIEINSIDKDNRNAFLIAVYFKNFDFAKFLLNEYTNVDISQIDQFQNSSLHLTLMINNFKNKKIYEKYANNNSIFEFTKFLITKLYKKLKEVNNEGNNILHLSLKYHHTNLAKYLIEVEKFDINLINTQKKGFNCLFLGVQSKCDQDFLLYLIEKGAEIRSKNFYQSHLLFYSIENHFYSFSNLICEKIFHLDHHILRLNYDQIIELIGDSNKDFHQYFIHNRNFEEIPPNYLIISYYFQFIISSNHKMTIEKFIQKTTPNNILVWKFFAFLLCYGNLPPNFDEKINLYIRKAILCKEFDFLTYLINQNVIKKEHLDLFNSPEKNILIFSVKVKAPMKFIQLLIEDMKMDPFIVDQRKSNLLMITLQYRPKISDGLFHYLFQFSFDPNYENDQNRNVLHFLNNQNEEISLLFLKQKINLLTKSFIDFIIRSIRKRIDNFPIIFIKEAIKLGFNINRVLNIGSHFYERSILFCAISSWHFDLAFYLLIKNCDLIYPNEHKNGVPLTNHVIGLLEEVNRISNLERNPKTAREWNVLMNFAKIKGIDKTFEICIVKKISKKDWKKIFSMTIRFRPFIFHPKQ